MSEHLLTPFQRTWAMMLHTRKRDGSWIGTPVNVAVDGDRAYFGTPASAAKVKRIRNFADVAIAPSTPRGTPTGSFVGARARLLRGDEAIAASRLLRRKYRFVHSILVPLELRIRRTKGLLYELTDIRAADHESLRGRGRRIHRRAASPHGLGCHRFVALNAISSATATLRHSARDATHCVGLLP